MTALWLGNDARGASLAEARALDAGLSSLRARIVGHIASFKDCWVFRGRIASAARCSVRTVQRAISQAKAEGLIGVARAKRGECPPGARGPLPCGWSHRWIVGRGLAGDALRAAVARAKLHALTRQLGRTKSNRLMPDDRARVEAAELERRRQDARRRLAEFESQLSRGDP